MSEKIVRFSRLLKVFQLGNRPAYIIELEENNQKTLYISYGETIENIRYFESYNESTLKEEFKDLSNHCLMSQCTDASNMFKGSPITHFEVDCPNLNYGDFMFDNSALEKISSKFPMLESGNWMFSGTKIKEMTINFPKLRNGRGMFDNSAFEKITSQFPMLKNGDWMFDGAPLKEMNSQFPKLIYKNSMFDNTPPEFKRDYPYYFI